MTSFQLMIIHTLDNNVDTNLTSFTASIVDVNGNEDGDEWIDRVAYRIGA